MRKRKGYLSVLTLAAMCSLALVVAAPPTRAQTAASWNDAIDVNGTLISPIVKIAGGTLSGAGTITGNVVNDATVAPPVFPGLRINGAYTQGADGTLAIDISSPMDLSLLYVTGKASLGGTVDFVFPDAKLT